VERSRYVAQYLASFALMVVVIVGLTASLMPAKSACELLTQARQIDCGDAIDRAHGHQQIDPQQNGTPRRKQRSWKCPASLAHETRPNEHERHQEDVLERTEQVEAEPALAIDDRVAKDKGNGSRFARSAIA
jgi:hypothetical protein